MITARCYPEGTAKELEPEDVSEAIMHEDQLVWVDVGSPDEADLAVVQDEFSLHPLAMEDVRERHQRPKLEHYPTHAFLVAYTAEHKEVNFFIGPTWLITIREDDSPGELTFVDGARKRFERTRPEHTTVGFLLYVLLDELVDGYFIRNDEVEDQLEELENRIFSEATREERLVQQELFEVRRRLLIYRRMAVPLRDVLAALLRREVGWIDDVAVTHLQDVFDHVLRVIDIVDNHRELMGNAVDAHLAIISNRMNKVMKRMTSWGAILLGSTLITGVYGMNFEHMPELSWKWGFWWALGLMAFITIAGYLWFKAKDWL
ncbi:MAG: magnesium/cobalt transporter CorA [Actinomycetota bacterium]|nr:magnesium/cobalt transporter CorA [Actinomycetota bacterium]